MINKYVRDQSNLFADGNSLQHELRNELDIPMSATHQHQWIRYTSLGLTRRLIDDG